MLALSLLSLLLLRYSDSLSHTNPRSLFRPTKTTTTTTTNRCFTRVRECVNFSTFNASAPPSFSSFSLLLPSPLWRTHTLLLCFHLKNNIRYLEKHNPHNRSTTWTIVFFALHTIKIFTHFSTFTHTPLLLAALQQRHHSAAAVFCQWPTNSSASQLFFNTRSVTRSPFSSRSLRCHLFLCLPSSPLLFWITTRKIDSTLLLARFVAEAAATAPSFLLLALSLFLSFGHSQIIFGFALFFLSFCFGFSSYLLFAPHHTEPMITCTGAL